MLIPSIRGLGLSGVVSGARQAVQRKADGPQGAADVTASCWKGRAVVWVGELVLMCSARARGAVHSRNCRSYVDRAVKVQGIYPMYATMQSSSHQRCSCWLGGPFKRERLRAPVTYCVWRFNPLFVDLTHPPHHEKKYPWDPLLLLSSTTSPTVQGWHIVARRRQDKRNAIATTQNLRQQTAPCNDAGTPTLHSTGGPGSPDFTSHLITLADAAYSTNAPATMKTQWRN
jgi:hypothetical protein